MFRYTRAMGSPLDLVWGVGGIPRFSSAATSTTKAIAIGYHANPINPLSQSDSIVGVEG